MDTTDASPRRQPRAGANWAGGEDLTAVMSRLARALQSEHGSVEDTLQAITSATVSGVPGAEFAGVTLVTGRRRLENRAATDPLVTALDTLQAEVGQGPCLQSVWEQETVRVDDMSTEERWPRFASRAAGMGVASMLSFQLFVQGDNLGALNMYAQVPGAFDQSAEDMGLIFAGHAAVALVGAQHEAQLVGALDFRDVIGMAKGMLMERYHIRPDQAFALLARVSQETNVKLRDVAARWVHAGRSPTPTELPRNADGSTAR